MDQGAHISLRSPSERGTMKISDQQISREKDISTMLVEDVLSPKSCDHTKGTKHSEMKEASSWEVASQEHNNSFWSRWEM